MLFRSGSREVQVTCPAGFVASDGMWSGDGPVTWQNVRIVRSQRTADGRGWTFTLWNDAQAPLAYSVGVGCARAAS